MVALIERYKKRYFIRLNQNFKLKLKWNRIQLLFHLSTHSYKYKCQLTLGRSQPHNLGSVRVPLSSIFSNFHKFVIFVLSLALRMGDFAHLGRSWLKKGGQYNLYYACVKGYLEPTHLKSSPLFTFSTKSLGQDSPSVHLFSKTFGSIFTPAKIKLGEDSPS